jgi:tRNA-Thr(GGU) m(6)t(6)A37 methyltransferase TsaA
MTEQPTPAATLTLVPIGTVRGGRSEPIDDDWGAVTCQIVLDGQWPADALAGLEDFSHVDVVYVFDQVDEATITVGARHPRNNAAWPKVGIFAQRAKGRPNRLGVTTCEIVGVHGRVVTVRGLDAIDGTPVVDLKPYMVEFAPRTAVRQPAWSHELMRGYWHGPGEPPAADETLRIERLTDQLELARDAFQMMHEVFDEGGVALSEHYVAQLLGEPRFHAFVAVEAGEPVGCITAHDLPMTRHECDESFVYDLAVRADRQRRGIGRLLVEALVADAAARGVDVVFVPADNDDDHALAFYTSLGGRPAPVTMFDLGAE